MNQFALVSRRLWNWLLEKRQGWIFIAGVLAIPATLIYVNDSPANAIRYAGLIFEAIGIYVVYQYIKTH